MKRSLILLTAVTCFIKSPANSLPSLYSAQKETEIVDAIKIQALKDSLEADSNLQFTISHFTYVDLDSLTFDSIITDLRHGCWPTFNKIFITYSETHYAYDESLSRPYTGKQYLAINRNGWNYNFIIFWVNPKKYRQSFVRRE